MPTFCSRKLFTCKLGLSFLLGGLPCLMERPSNDSNGNHHINPEKSIDLLLLIPKCPTWITGQLWRCQITFACGYLSFPPLPPPAPHFRPKWRSDRQSSCVSFPRPQPEFISQGLIPLRVRPQIWGQPLIAFSICYHCASAHYSSVTYRKQHGAGDIWTEGWVSWPGFLSLLCSFLS